jgi:methionine-rich copper-binding protein CopC
MKYSTLVLVLLGSLALATGAEAHTKLTVTVPAEAASVPAPVKEIVLEFAGDVRLTAVALNDASGAKKAVADVPTALAAKFALAVRDELAPGSYVVTWRAVGADTHVVSGEIHFSVTAPHSH